MARTANIARLTRFCTILVLTAGVAVSPVLFPLHALFAHGEGEHHPCAGHDSACTHSPPAPAAASIDDFAGAHLENAGCRVCALLSSHHREKAGVLLPVWDFPELAGPRLPVWASCSSKACLPARCGRAPPARA